MRSKTSNGIAISVKSFFLQEMSRPEEDTYMWGYKIKIRNRRSKQVRLISRFWRIIDAQGHIEESEGVGVVGEQPFLNPGSSYEYASGALLGTPSGMMIGSYTIETSEGVLQVDIPAFSLDSPYQAMSLQ